MGRERGHKKRDEAVMNTLFLISRLTQDVEDFHTNSAKKAVKLTLELGKGVIEGMVFGEHESGAVKLLYQKGDYIIIEGSLVQFENKTVLLIKDHFFFPLSQREAKSIARGYTK